MNYTTEDLVRIANERWAQIAERTGLPAYSCEQIVGMCLHVSELLGENTKTLWEGEDENDPALLEADRLLGAFQRGLTVANIASKTDNQDLLTVAAVGLHADAYGIAELAQPDGSLLAAQIGDLASAHDTDTLARIVGGDLLHRSFGENIDEELGGPKSPKNPTGQYLALWRIPAERADQWRSWRERIDGTEPDPDRPRTAEQRAARDELRALAADHG